MVNEGENRSSRSLAEDSFPKTAKPIASYGIRPHLHCHCPVPGCALEFTFQPFPRVLGLNLNPSTLSSFLVMGFDKLEYFTSTVASNPSDIRMDGCVLTDKRGKGYKIEESQRISQQILAFPKIYSHTHVL
ncbi:hypothetical protein D9758_013489 [Tetrapyrgos nigripes]|uniref:Uncharacterized protein n=1 Tax=Tetrapyrgos nigripes TaxID=182062 RepID=A0A8H5FS06_9AGAR|nr:hypothetical protein D9758_013489 [Tetrapyrgos nigripes]